MDALIGIGLAIGSLVLGPLGSIGLSVGDSLGPQGGPLGSPLDGLSSGGGEGTDAAGQVTGALSDSFLGM